MPPMLAWVPRRSARVGAAPLMTAPARNVRPVERIAPHESPDPIRQGETPSRPARMPIVTFQSAAAIRAVMENEFRFAIVAPYPGAQPLDGRQAPVTERVNIHRRAAEAYGSLLTLNPPNYWEGVW